MNYTYFAELYEKIVEKLSTRIGFNSIPANPLILKGKGMIGIQRPYPGIMIRAYLMPESSFSDAELPVITVIHNILVDSEESNDKGKGRISDKRKGRIDDKGKGRMEEDDSSEDTSDEDVCAMPSHMNRYIKTMYEYTINIHRYRVKDNLDNIVFEKKNINATDAGNQIIDMCTNEVDISSISNWHLNPPPITKYTYTLRLTPYDEKEEGNNEESNNEVACEENLLRDEDPSLRD
jgi:hypothetical protein